MENTPLERLDTVNAYIVCSEVFDGHYLFDPEQELHHTMEYPQTAF